MCTRRVCAQTSGSWRRSHASLGPVACEDSREPPRARTAPADLSRRLVGGGGLPRLLSKLPGLIEPSLLEQGTRKRCGGGREERLLAHLDEPRRAALFDELVALGAQAWLTGTDRALFAGLRERAQFLDVADGAEIALPGADHQHGGRFLFFGCFRLVLRNGDRGPEQGGRDGQGGYATKHTFLLGTDGPGPRQAAAGNRAPVDPVSRSNSMSVGTRRDADFS